MLEDKNHQQIISQEEMALKSAQQMGSKKNNMQKGKRTFNNLGAASKYLDGDDNREIQGQEKVAFVRKGDRYAKDKVKVKYNYQDFLNQFENLSEQCVYLVETLAQGK